MLFVSRHSSLIRIVALVVVFALCMFQGPSRGQAQQDMGPDCILAAYYPPFVFGDTPENAGISIEIIRAAAARLGRDITIEIEPFQRVLRAVQTESTCMMPVLFRNETRETLFQWIATYHAAELSFLTMGSPVNTIEEGRQLDRIAVETDSSADRFLTNQGFENLERISDPASSVRMLQVGRIDAWAQSGLAATKLWEQLGLTGDLQVGTPFYSVQVYLVAGPEFPQDIATIYRDAIRGLVADGTVEKVISEYY